MINWIPVEQVPQPSTPYGWYLVWLRGVDGAVEDGTCDCLQYSRDAEKWIMRRESSHLVITHYAEVSPPANNGVQPNDAASQNSDSSSVGRVIG